MTPIDMLMEEHRFIERFLEALAGYARQLGEGADPADLDRFVTFIVRFTDACHHGKEEKILFEAMIGAGFPREAGPIGVMLQEHGEGRRLVGILRDAAARAASWTADDRRSVEQAAVSFAILLRNHIAKEDACLYPMAKSALSAEAFADMEQRFERFQAEQTGSGEHENLHGLAEQLIARYAPNRTAAHKNTL